MAAQSQPAKGSRTTLREAKKKLQEELAGEPPVAYSIDGQMFLFDAPLQAAVPIGGYVEIKLADGKQYLGQILEQQIVERAGPEVGLVSETKGTVWVLSLEQQAHLKDTLTVRLLKGRGILLGQFSASTFELLNRMTPFQDANMMVASAAVVDHYFTKSKPNTAAMDIGLRYMGRKVECV